MHESVLHRATWFMTLTYAPENLPVHGSLSLRDVTLFLKRLRKKTSELRYFMCGEYGERTDRPHYHAVLFGPSFPDREVATERNGVAVFTSRQLDETWGHGLTEFTRLNYQAAAYVAGYVRKKIRQKDYPEAYNRVDPVTGEIVRIKQEYATMSRRPAIGRRWIERYWTDVYPRDFVVIDGIERKPPRYYDKWMETNQPEIMMNVRRDRIEKAQVATKRELRAREAHHEARVCLYSGRDAV